MKFIPYTNCLILACMTFLHAHNTIAKTIPDTKKHHAVSSTVPDAKRLSDDTVRSGDYEIYYSAFNSTFISPDVASAYKLSRGPRIAIVNVAVRNTKHSQIGKAVTANINGKAKNLLGQISTLNFQEIKEGDAIYYLASFRFNNEDTLNFNLDIQPERGTRTDHVKFEQQFYEN